MKFTNSGGNGGNKKIDEKEARGARPGLGRAADENPTGKSNPLSKINKSEKKSASGEGSFAPALDKHGSRQGYKRWLINGAIFSVAFVAYLIYALLFEESGIKAENQISGSLNEIVEGSFNSAGSNTSPAAFSGDYSELMEFLSGYENHFRNEFVEANKAAGGQLEPLIRQIADKPGYLAGAKLNPGEIRNQIYDFQKRNLASSKKFADKLSKVTIPGDEKNILRGDLTSLIKSGNENLSEYYKLQLEILELAESLEKFLEACKGAYRIAEGELLFEKKEMQEKYRNFGIELLNLKRREGEWLSNIEVQGGIADDKLIRAIEDYIWTRASANEKKEK